jgi:hypothetical protein
LLIAHGLFPLDRLYAFNETTVAAYTQAIVTGTLKSRESLNRLRGIENGGAKKEDPAGGGASVRGSLRGGRWKREVEGELSLTEAIFAGVEGLMDIADKGVQQ